MDWTQLAVWLRAAVALLVPILWHVARAQAALTDDKRVRELLLELVKAAEQIYGAGRGDEKRGYVLDQAIARRLPADRARIEAAVHDLRQAGPARRYNV